MVSKHTTLSEAVREITGSRIGFRVSDVISVGTNLFTKVNNRYVPIGYLVTYNVNVYGGGTLTFSLWFPLYYTDFYTIGRMVSHYLISRAGAFSYTIRMSTFVNRGTFRITSGNLITEGIFKYQWVDTLCYFEIEIERNCITGRVISRRNIKLQKCNFIPPNVPSKLNICISIPPKITFIRPSWAIPEEMMKRTYAELRAQLSSPNYDLFRTAICAYQLMVETDASFYAAVSTMSKLEGIPASTITTYMINSKFVVKAFPPRVPNRRYDPYGVEVQYVAYTKESPSKKARGTALELRFNIWQPYYATVPFRNIYQVIESLFNSLGSAWVANESIVLGMIRKAGGNSIMDLPQILRAPPTEVKYNRAVFRNRDRYTISLIKSSGDGWRYQGIYRYQWKLRDICYLYIETLRLCARTYGSRSGKEEWTPSPGYESNITDEGFAFCDWLFDEHLRYSTATLNFSTVCNR